MEIDASPQEKRRLASGGDSHLPAEMRFEELPLGVYVKLDDCKREFLPPTPCEQHRRAGFSTACAECRAFEGWVLVEPMRRSWKFADPVTGATLTVSRSQLPLMPASACPLYSLQGMTCDPSLIAHFAMPRRADDDIKWALFHLSKSLTYGCAIFAYCFHTVRSLVAIEFQSDVVWSGRYASFFQQRRATSCCTGRPICVDVFL